MSEQDSFADFLRRLRAGDQQAAAELVRRYERVIRREARLRLTDPRLGRLVDSVDICQSVLASFFVRAAAGQYDLGRPDDLLRLLVRMARNKVVSQARRHRARPADWQRGAAGALELTPAGGPDPGRLAAAADLLAEVYRRLDPGERQVAELRGQGRSWPEVARELGARPRPGACNSAAPSIASPRNWDLRGTTMNSFDPAAPARTPPDVRETPVEELWRRWRQEQCPDFADGAADPAHPDHALAVLRFDQYQRWHSGERVPAEHYLQTYAVLKTDPEQAVIIIYAEFLLRQELGENPTLDAYLQRFPEHAALLQEQHDFHQAVEGVSWAGAGAPAEAPRQAGSCRLVGEIARGGMGVVLRGQDEQLGRDLAVKVLRSEYRDQPDVVRRFLEEAQVSGQLQHPGVVPIHELGRLADGRPYFTMKLVQGRTLAELLARRSEPAHDLPHLLKVFEQVCQTVAYAHARGVIHRDLKPANVMVGAFGEVQVMDWGLAKVRTAPQPPSEGGGAEPIHTVRSGQVDAESRAGTVIGTPAYIAPEQARGDPSRMDERCDVFGLSAILCEILTGQPLYAGRHAPEVLHQARQGQLGEARARLDSCGADAELIQLAKDCLEAAPEARPRDAGAVAARVTAYLAGVQERLKAAELAQAAAHARAEEAAAKAAAERRARRLTAGLASCARGELRSRCGRRGSAATFWSSTRSRRVHPCRVAAVSQLVNVSRLLVNDNRGGPCPVAAAAPAIPGRVRSCAGSRPDNSCGTNAGVWLGSAARMRRPDKRRRGRLPGRRRAAVNADGSGAGWPEGVWSCCPTSGRPRSRHREEVMTHSRDVVGGPAAVPAGIVEDSEDPWQGAEEVQGGAVVQGQAPVVRPGRPGRRVVVEAAPPVRPGSGWFRRRGEDPAQGLRGTLGARTRATSRRDPLVSGASSRATLISRALGARPPVERPPAGLRPPAPPSRKWCHARRRPGWAR